jgi:uncharacterized membrane protein YjdF
MPRAPQRLALPADPAERLHRLVLIGLQAVMALELAALLWRGQWLSAVTVIGIMGLALSPLILRKRLSVRVPYGFQILVVAFVFAALFLGEVRRFYHLYPWWDSVLHLGSGLLLGMLGFMLIYVLNEDERIHLSTKPGFMALFAFCFALSLGALWEIFEFAMDRLFGAQMQKPMFGDESGLTDTMWDLMLDALGGLIISIYGYVYMRQGAKSFISGWIQRFARENPDWFERARLRRRRDQSKG